MTPNQAEQPSTMGQPQHQSSTERRVQDYLRWLNTQQLTGFTFQAGGPQERSFIPETAIKTYFSDSDPWEIKALFRAASRHDVDVEAVARDCPKVFSILIRLDCPQYIHLFAGRSDLHDRALPFGPRRDSDFPRAHLKDGRTLFEAFEKEQWHFCVESLSHGLHEVEFESRRILPIASIEPLPKGEGVSGIAHKIIVHEQYDGLKRTRDRNRGSLASVSSNDEHAYVIKTYHAEDGAQYFEAELRAFRHLNQAGNAVPAVIGFHRAFKQSTSLNLILQYANVGTLEDYFQKVPRPELGADILKVWKRLAAVNNALEGIHKRLPEEPRHLGDSKAGRPSIFQGWHQDIKPRNILVRGNLKEDPYGVEFFLADLGLTHFTAVSRGEAGTTGEDLPGPRTYGAPELNLGSDTPASEYLPEEKQKLDIWSLACVYSEFNTWAVLGYARLEDYRRQRQSKLDSRFGPAFHDCVEQAVLDVVPKQHDYLTKVRSVVDNITPLLWAKVLNQAFHTLPDVRPNARQLRWAMEMMFEQAEELLPPHGRSTRYNEPEYPLRTRTPPQLPPEFQNGVHEHSIGASTSYLSRHTSPTTPVHTIGPAGYGLTQSPDADQVAFPLSTMNPDFRSVSQPADLGHRADETLPRQHRVNHNRPATDLSLHAASIRLNSLQWEDSVRSERRRPGKQYNTSAEDDERQSTENSQSFSNATEATGSTSRCDKEKDVTKEVTMEHDNRATSKSQQPYLTVKQLKDWVRLTQTSRSTIGGLIVSGSDAFDLSEDPSEGDLLKKMRERDHIFIIDDAETMKKHWTPLSDLYQGLAYMIKKKRLDPNGSELRFLQTDCIMEQKNTSSMVEEVKRRRYKLKGSTDFAMKIDKVLSDYLQRLQKYASKVRPITIYVLTNGLWDTTNVETKDYQLESVAAAIEKHFNALDRMIGVSEKQVGIQFIQFGNEPIGSSRLRYLDQELPKKRGLTRDICDTEPADGNVWKMMLGSIDSAWDDDAE